MYTKGDIEVVPTGWQIQVLDPHGGTVALLHYIMTIGEPWSPYVDGCLNNQADRLLSHLNRK